MHFPIISQAMHPALFWFIILSIGLVVCVIVLALICYLIEKTKWWKLRQCAKGEHEWRSHQIGGDAYMQVRQDVCDHCGKKGRKWDKWDYEAIAYRARTGRPIP